MLQCLAFCAGSLLFHFVAPINKHDNTNYDLGGAATSWLMRWTTDRALHVQALPGTLRCVLAGYMANLILASSLLHVCKYFCYTSQLKYVFRLEENASRAVG